MIAASWGLVGVIGFAGSVAGFVAALWERGWIPSTTRWRLRRSVRRARMLLAAPSPAAVVPRYRPGHVTVPVVPHSPMRS